MKIVFISDTHGQHDLLNLPSGDMIVHAGDVSSRGTHIEVFKFLNWFGNLDFKYKIFIAGNHDFFFEIAESSFINSMIPEGVMYLNDTGVEIEGIKIWGSPIQPWFNNWAFNRERGEEIKQYWNKIPDNLDILITHGPPNGILDKTIRGESVGCEDLYDTISKVKPKIHVFGHIHEAYGVESKNGISFINASVLNLSYQMTNLPVTLTV
ncbi:metallophosphatase domain-containing protein [Maribacter polysiphoniae]|uniref:Icc-related predicted phosphoesterase n=1 Tax=Maribacter polysiphoniae TaxID=429344 RepID=A0A316DJZ9_9FLAO|nr:metallophosphatase domain-containing protein [Maribacter polysiphoniae]MBD1263116.1 metallophosphatase domain-containing protein [Maribacter polysiphoniae]PWK16993.1 Icc-related predicted phosphoesterase [Maribacter polysiphoniae]|tara:strand:+ start:17 stop:643 length:627 start_codon:yes stop_codon:yes gene_type:complete